MVILKDFLLETMSIKTFKCLSWENQEALDAHHNSKIMKRIIELRNKYYLMMKVERFIDDNNIPKSDDKFIRK